MFQVPTNNEDAVQVLDHLRCSADSYANLHRVRWLISHYWMQGLRDLNRDYINGTVEARMLNKESSAGRGQMVYEKILPKLLAEMGRLMRMDIRPSCERRGHALAGIRKAATGRVVLDHLTSSTNWDNLKMQFFYHLCMFGMCGVAAWTRNAPSLGAAEETPSTSGGVVIELIPSWELFPVPYNPGSPVELQGILRKRWVPLKWLKKHKDLSFPKDREKLRILKSPYGVKPGSSQPLTVGVPDTNDAAQFNTPQQDVHGGGKAGKVDVEYVLLEEWWFLQEENDRLASYIVKVGDAILLRDPAGEETYSRNVYCPIGLARYYPVGGFYGRSFVEIQIPLNKEQEDLAASLFQNVKDLEAYPTTLIPQSWGISRNELLSKGKRRKVQFYEFDQAAPEARVETIAPVTTNDFPGKVLAYAERMMDGLSSQSDLLKGDAPGRVDSEAGLSFLSEQANVPLSVPANSVANAFAQVYNSILASAPELLSDRKQLPLIGVDDSIIGLRVSPDRSTVTLAPDNFPRPDEVIVAVRDKLPASTTARKNELMMMLKMGVITPMEFRLTCHKEAIDLPVANWAEQESYRKAVLNCIFLFGDGESPGPVIASSEADLADVHLLVIQAFMAKPEFQFASEEVRGAFVELKTSYLNAKGRGYPEMMPMPDEAAMIEQTRRKMMGAAGPVGPAQAGGPGVGNPPGFSPAPPAGARR